MFHPQLIAVLTALGLLAEASPARADYTLEQLQNIEGLISTKNCAGLWTFVQANPGLTSGDDPLANELRVFVASTERGQLNCFAARAPKAPVGEDPLPQVAVTAIVPIY